MAVLFHLETLQIFNEREREKKEEEARGKYDVATQCGIDLPVSIKHFLLPTYKPSVANLHQIRVYFLKNKSMVSEISQTEKVVLILN